MRILGTFKDIILKILRFLVNLAVTLEEKPRDDQRFLALFYGDHESPLTRLNVKISKRMDNNGIPNKL